MNSLSGQQVATSQEILENQSINHIKSCLVTLLLLNSVLSKQVATTTSQEILDNPIDYQSSNHTNSQSDR